MVLQDYTAAAATATAAAVVLIDTVGLFILVIFL